MSEINNNEELFDGTMKISVFLILIVGGLMTKTTCSNISNSKKFSQVMWILWL